MGLRRYPGATPFSRRQSNIFYGRDKDIYKLLTMIKVEKKVLLYSKSGLGKTSLLEAGVLPKLPPNYTTISIRLFAYKPGAETPLERVINALKTVVDDLDTRNDTIIDQIIGDNEKDKTLWYYFKKAQLLAPLPEDDDSENIFTLVFDQFEELFSFPKKDIDDFKNQLYALTELKLPDRVAVLIAEGRQNNSELFGRETIKLLYKRIETKTIFAIRSDRLSLLNNLSDKLPDIQSTFYELLPLDYEQAMQAIVNPAADKDPAFETPPFVFHKDAIEKIINELSDGRTDIIETTQLQIVCHRIEEIATEKHTGGTVEIEVDDLPEFKNIFLNFYFDSIDRLQEESRDKAKRLIEDELIRNHQRISLDQEICKEYLDEKELRNLVDTHLLRAERNTFGRFSYEVSHDTLVEPILESQKKYREELEKIRLEKERQEELRKLKEQQEQEARERDEELRLIKEQQDRKEKERRRKLRQQRTISAIVTIFFIISAVLGYQANEAKNDAREALKKLKEEQFERYKTAGETLLGDREFDRASASFSIARTLLDSLDTRRDEMAGLIAECERLIANQDKNDSILARADSLIHAREYLQAMREFNQVIADNYDTLRVHNQRRALRSHASAVFQKDLDDFKEIDDTTWIKITQERLNILEELFNKF